MNFRSGFTLGDWTVYPLEGRLVRDVKETRVQPKSMDVLLCLAENAGEVVERDTILRLVWGDRAQSDEPLTRCIGELRRALGDTSAEPAYILTIPKRGYRLLQSAVGIGEAGDDEERDADPTLLTDAQRELRFDTLKKVCLGALVIILAVFAEVLFERFLDNTEFGGDPVLVPPDKSVAVLPFSNLSSDREQEWFADGLTEEILNTLTRMPDLMVSSRTSSFVFKNSDEEVTAIAKQLGVAHILEGSVRRGTDTVRVTAQLIRASDGFHLWSDTFDKKPDDVIVIQEELAFAIGNALETAMDPEALSAMVSAGTTSVPAYEHYLEAIALINRCFVNG